MKLGPRRARAYAEILAHEVGRLLCPTHQCLGDGRKPDNDRACPMAPTDVRLRLHPRIHLQANQLVRHRTPENTERARDLYLQNPLTTPTTAQVAWSPKRRSNVPCSRPATHRRQTDRAQLCPVGTSATSAIPDLCTFGIHLGWKSSSGHNAGHQQRRRLSEDRSDSSSGQTDPGFHQLASAARPTTSSPTRHNRQGPA